MSTISPLLEAVHVTARLSALLFWFALLLPSVSARAARHAADLFLGFIVAHTVHFAVVVSYGLAVPGAAMFPEGGTLDGAGGWPTVAAVFLVFYLPALIGLAARRAGDGASTRLRGADRFATLFLAFMFVATWVPLISRSALFVVPTALTIVAAAVWLAARVTSIGCLQRT